jgi:hypothetical protein
MYILEFMILPGQVENNNMIIDSGKLGFTSFPVKILKAVLAQTKTNFRCLNYKTFIVNTSGGIGMIWKMIEPLIPKFSRAKTKLNKGIVC